MRRIFVIPDIHGCSRTFRQLLFNVIKLEKSDTLFLLGDYIDRGPDSKGVIDTFIYLQRCRYDVRPILGNHEDRLLKVLEVEKDEDMRDWLDNGGRETLKSYSVVHPDEISKVHLDFLQELPLYLSTDTHIFVHAGLNISLDDPLSETSREFMLWERMKNDVEPKNIDIRKVIVGHTVRSLDEIVASLDNGFIQLDNGCFMGSRFQGMGNLLALELQSGELFVQENIE